MKHELKTWPEYFAPVVDGTKTFEIRKQDRAYMAGDTLRLREWEPVSGEYTGSEVSVKVTYLMSGGPFAIPNHVVMAIRRCESRQ